MELTTAIVQERLGSLCNTHRRGHREQMLAGWVAEGRFGVPDSPQSKRKILLLTSTNAADKNLKTELLNERAAMLAEVRNRVSLMKRDLRDLMQGLRP